MKIVLRDLQLAFLEDYNHFLQFRKHNKELMNFLSNTSPLTSEQRVEIYQKSIIATLIKTLAEIYPVCNKLVGADFFNKMAMNYIKKHPSSSPSLCDYGNCFEASSLIYLADVCRLEWAWHVCYYSSDVIACDFPKLQKMDEEMQQQVIFKPPGGSALLHSRFPIHQIWQTNQDDYSGTDQIYLQLEDYYIFVWRKGYEVQIDLLNFEEWKLLKFLERRMPFENLCAEFIEKNPEIDLMTALSKIVKRGWVTF